MPHPSGYLDSSGPGVCGEGIPQADRISARIHLMMTMFPEGQELRRRGDPFIPWGFVQAFERSGSDFSVMGKEQAGSIGGFPRLPVRIPTGSGGRWERGVFSVGECRGGNRHGGSEAPASERGGISVRGRCAWGIQGVEGAGCPELRGGGSTKAGEPVGGEFPLTRSLRDYAAKGGRQRAAGCPPSTEGVEADGEPDLVAASDPAGTSVAGEKAIPGKVCFRQSAKRSRATIPRRRRRGLRKIEGTRKGKDSEAAFAGVSESGGHPESWRTGRP